MAREQDTQDHLSDYERAVCYYTLPRFTTPLTLGLIVAYAVCLFEALAAFAYGLIVQDPTWMRWGGLAFGGIVIFGIVIFICRAIINEVRHRRTLAFAEGYPDASSKAGDIPDPFEDHTLLRYPRHAAGGPLLITDNRGDVQYTVERRGRHTLELFDREGEVSVRIVCGSRARSFAFIGHVPGQITVYRGDHRVAGAQRVFSLRAPKTVITMAANGRDEITARAGGLFRGEELIGRVYTVRGFVYLDVEKDSFNDGILGFFVAMV